ncbi:hypothetical protein [Herbaspirillum huttiense]|uniref:hypothetical protein n=1 Tax=Herbaspirillum huttiense TaxID=863372 RepID=UPI002176CAE7|nr:hypothetical protein [Herbaspirillum huttiense]UWE18532.1 hypothetical protein NY669_10250 [Herbaspirillum huttiense]
MLVFLDEMAGQTRNRNFHGEIRATICNLFPFPELLDKKTCTVLTMNDQPPAPFPSPPDIDPERMKIPPSPLSPIPSTVAVLAYNCLICVGLTLLYALEVGHYFWRAAVAHAPLTARLPAIIGVGYMLFCSTSAAILAWALIRAKKWARKLWYGITVVSLLPMLIPTESARMTLASAICLLPPQVVFLYLMTRPDVSNYFAAGPRAVLPYPTSEKIRRALRSSLYVVAGIILIFSFHGLILGLAQTYPEMGRLDIFSAAALPVLLVAEGLGASPGAPRRLFNLCMSLTLMVTTSTVFYWVAIPDGPTSFQRRLFYWAIALISLSALLWRLMLRHRRAALDSGAST